MNTNCLISLSILLIPNDISQLRVLILNYSSLLPVHVSVVIKKELTMKKKKTITFSRRFTFALYYFDKKFGIWNTFL